MVVLDDVVVVVVDDVVDDVVAVVVDVVFVVVVDVVFVFDDDVVLSVVDLVVVVDVVVVLTVTVFVVMVVDFSVVDKVLKKSPRKGRSCVDPDPVELGTSEDDEAVLVMTATFSPGLDVEFTTLSMSNQVESPLLELSVVFSYKAGFSERDSNDTTEPLLRIIEGISLSISNGNSKHKH